MRIVYYFNPAPKYENTVESILNTIGEKEVVRVYGTDFFGLRKRLGLPDTKVPNVIVVEDGNLKSVWNLKNDD